MGGGEFVKYTPHLNPPLLRGEEARLKKCGHFREFVGG
jgi:hypothetical protein